VNGQNALHIASDNTNAIDKIMRDVASGRYGNSSDLHAAYNPVYMAIHQAYPNTISTTDAYNEARAVLIGSYNNYVEENNKLFSILDAYDSWRTDNFFQAKMIVWAGFPSYRLVVRDAIDGKTYKGAAAEDQMWMIVTDTQTAESYHTKMLQPIQFPTP
jgi:hypothetical protein